MSDARNAGIDCVPPEIASGSHQCHVPREPAASEVSCVEGMQGLLFRVTHPHMVAGCRALGVLRSTTVASYLQAVVRLSKAARFPATASCVGTCFPLSVVSRHPQYPWHSPRCRHRALRLSRPAPCLSWFSGRWSATSCLPRAGSCRGRAAPRPRRRSREGLHAGSPSGVPTGPGAP